MRYRNLIYLLIILALNCQYPTGNKQLPERKLDPQEVNKQIDYYSRLIKENLPFKEILWTGVVGEKIRRLTLWEKDLYVEGESKRLYCLNTETGLREWQLNLDNFLDYPLTPIIGIPERETYLKNEIAKTKKALADEEKNNPPDENKIYTLKRNLKILRDEYFHLKDRDFIYFICKNRLYCVDRFHGYINWYKDLEFVSGTGPAATLSAVYIGALDFNRVYQFDVVKKYSTQFFRADSLVGFAPICAELANIIYFTDDKGKVYAYHTITGDKLWEYPTERPIKAPPLLDGEVLYVASTDFALYALDIYSGRLIWKYECGYPITTQPQVGLRQIVTEKGTETERVIYFRADKDALNALLVTYTLDEEGRIITKPKLRWRLPEGKSFLMYGVASCYVLGIDDQTLFDLEIETGQLKRKYSLKDFPIRLANPPEHVMYLGTEDGYIFAVREPLPK